jgi:N-hydroxyarylamine O-acetyltransferase
VTCTTLVHDVPDSLTDAYLARVGVTRPRAADLAALRELHAAHVSTIPFENLDILLGAGISLDLRRIYAKLVNQRRGGYCFEHNTLFLSVLKDLGFAAAPLEARVRMGSAAVGPRTHMVLSVWIEAEEWLADVGFGGEGPIEPVPMSPDRASDSVHRVVTEGTQRVLQMRSGGGWIDLYAFLPQSVHPVDFEVANWYTSTYPQSRFVRTLTAQRTTRDVRYVLRYPTYTEIRGGEVRTREISRSELVPLLRDVFLIDVPADARFSAID